MFESVRALAGDSTITSRRPLMTRGAPSAPAGERLAFFRAAFAAAFGRAEALLVDA
jgi:hypothetical protein